MPIFSSYTIAASPFSNILFNKKSPVPAFLGPSRWHGHTEPTTTNRLNRLGAESVKKKKEEEKKICNDNTQNEIPYLRCSCLIP